MWSCPCSTSLAFPALFILTFLRNHHLLQLTNRPQWLTVAGRTQQGYVDKVTAPFRHRLHTDAAVAALAVLPDQRLQLTLSQGQAELFDFVILACHAPTSLQLLGAGVSLEERELLSCFEYQDNDVVLHQDASFMPRNAACWSSWNWLGGASPTSPSSLTYFLNRLQNLPPTQRPVLVTLNPQRQPDPALTLSTTRMAHPVPSAASCRAQTRLADIQGKRGLWFAGAWAGYGFHEDGYKSGEEAAWSVLQAVKQRSRTPGEPRLNGLKAETAGEKQAAVHSRKPTDDFGFVNGMEPGATNGRDAADGDASPPAVESSVWPAALDSSYAPLPNPVSFHERYSLLSLVTPARLIVLRFLRSFVKEGCLQLREVGGSIETFGSPSAASPPCVLDVQSPAFYTHVAFRADLGLADAFIDGSFSSPSLLRFLQLLITNRDLHQRSSSGGGRLSSLFTSTLTTTAAFLCQSWLKRNTVAQSRRNISHHYDTGNDFFALFLDPSMTYSCALYLQPSDSLDTAQQQKIDRLIAKACIQPHHAVLEIGCGWGSLSRAIAATKGCRVTGITLSSEQLSYCRQRAAESGLSHLLSYELVDYRRFSSGHQFDRIVSCEMLEAVGHEFLPEFFRHCDRLLGVDGLLVVQVITFPDSRYDEYRGNVDFIREQIFPGGLCPSLSALTAAMSSSSGLMVESVDNIGPHYARTLADWRDRLAAVDAETRRKMRLSEAVMRKWEYYFVYCQAGFLMRCVSTLHIVFTRPSNNAALGGPG